MLKKTLVALLVLSFLLPACGAAPQTTSQAIEDLPAESDNISTEPPTETSQPTEVPSPTPLPGNTVIPLESLGEGIPWLEYRDTNIPGVFFLAFNTQAAPFSSINVRKAFSAAIDHDAVFEVGGKFYVNNPRYSDSEVTWQVTHPEILGRNLGDENGLAFDPEQARAYLREAGYEDPSTFPDLSFRVSYAGDVAPGAWIQIAETMIAMWEEHLGITSIKVDARNEGYYQSLEEDRPGLFFVSWYADIYDPDNFIREIFVSDTYPNFTGYEEQEYLDLVFGAQNMNDPEQKQILYIQAEQYIGLTGVPLVPLFNYKITP